VTGAGLRRNGLGMLGLALGGLAVLAAVAAGWALGLAPELIGAGLRTFDSNPKKTSY